MEKDATANPGAGNGEDPTVDAGIAQAMGLANGQAAGVAQLPSGQSNLSAVGPKSTLTSEETPAPGEHPILDRNASRNINTLRSVAADPLSPEPWSPNWVFKGGEAQDPGQQSLFKESPADQFGRQLAAMAQAARAAQASAGAPGNGRAVAASDGVGAASPAGAELMAYLGQNQISDLEASGTDGSDELGATPNPARAALARELSGGDYLTTLDHLRDADAPTSAGAAFDPLMAGANAAANAGTGVTTRHGNTLQPADLRSIGDRGEADGKANGMFRVPNAGSARAKGPLDFGDGASGDPLSGASAAQAFRDPSATGSSGGMTAKPATTEVTGHVVKGAMSQDRLSSQSLAGMTTGIQSMQARGGGEMRIKMNPGNLGELNVRVQTRGNHVGLEIKASDDRAKEILESSLNHLKESLAGKQLNLARVDITVATSAAASSDNQNPFFGQNSSNQSSLNSGADNLWQQNQSRADWGSAGGEQSGRSNGGGEAPVSGIRAARPSVGSASAGRANLSGAASRLDVMA